MKAHFELKTLIQDIHNGECKLYKSIEGTYLFNDFALYIDHVNEDPYNPLAKTRVKVDQHRASFPNDTFSGRPREIALRDFLTRSFCYSVNSISECKTFLIGNTGQEILERTSAFVDTSWVEVRFTIRLPIYENRIDSRKAEEIFFEKLPKIIESSLLFENLDQDTLYGHIKISEDADFLRNELENLRLIAFVAEGSILPRESEVSSLPMDKGRAVPFRSPDKLKMDVELPNRGQITGMGIPRGITLIVGEKNQGKSTLLNAIQMGIYNHVPGDGREFVVSNPNSVKVRAESGRTVNSVDISAILPSYQNASSFSTDNADDTASQAVNIIEAVEVGADVLLMDQDTSARNFLSNDHRTEKKSEQQKKLDILFIDKVRGLLREYMVSTIFILETPFDHNHFADFVIRMTNYEAEEVTSEVNNNYNNSKSENEKYESFGTYRERIPLAFGTDYLNSASDKNSTDMEIHRIQDGENLPYLSSVEQIVSDSQLNAIEKAIVYSKKYIDGKKSLRQVLSLVMLDLGKSGLNILDSDLSGQYTEFRKIELAAAINRLKDLQIVFKV